MNMDKNLEQRMKMGTIDRSKDHVRVTLISGCLLVIFVLCGLFAFTEQPCNIGQFVKNDFECKDCSDYLTKNCLECSRENFCTKCIEKWYSRDGKCTECKL